MNLIFENKIITGILYATFILSSWLLLANPFRKITVKIAVIGLIITSVAFLVKLTLPLVYIKYQKNGVGSFDRLMASQQVLGIFMAFPISPLISIFYDSNVSIAILILGILIFSLSSSIRVSIRTASTDAKYIITTLVILKDLGILVMLAYSIFKFQEWVSCGCWENPTKNITQTILFYVIGTILISWKSKAKLSKEKILSSIASALILIGYLSEFLIKINIPDTISHFIYSATLYPVADTFAHILVCMRLNIENSESNIKKIAT